MKEELQAHQNAAQNKIARALQEFTDKTGLIPSRIDFEMIDTSTVDDIANAAPKFTTGTVTLIANTAGGKQ